MADNNSKKHTPSPEEWEAFFGRCEIEGRGSMVVDGHVVVLRLARKHKTRLEFGLFIEADGALVRAHRPDSLPEWKLKLCQPVRRYQFQERLRREFKRLSTREKARARKELGILDIDAKKTWYRSWWEDTDQLRRHFNRNFQDIHLLGGGNG